MGDGLVCLRQVKHLNAWPVPAGRAVLRNDHLPGLTILDHERLPVRWKLRIDRHVGTAAFQYGQLRYQHLHTARHNDRDEIAGSDAYAA